MTGLSGHDEPWRAWQAAMASGRMHHGWILAGPQGIGKATFARAAAAALVAEPGVPQPAPEMHPDILIPEHPPATKEDEKRREAGEAYARKRSIPIDEIRAMEHRLNTRPTLGARRAVIIDPADDMETAAVNALLKSLEEPPQGTFFLLVAHRPGRLLPTIRSRCRILRFAALPDAEVARILAASAPQIDAGTRGAAVAAAGGSPGVALDFVEEDLGKVHAIMTQLLAGGGNPVALTAALVGEVGARPARARQAAVLELARAELAVALRPAGRDRQAVIIAAHEAISRLANEAPLYNYDPSLLAGQLGHLLAGVGAA